MQTRDKSDPLCCRFNRTVPLSAVTYCTMEEDTGLYDGERASLKPGRPFKKLAWNEAIACSENLISVQVNSADQRLRVFDSTHKRWRQVCSSPANEFLASISCEEVGFVR